MAGNTIGKLFTVTTSGESHGPGMSAIVDGCPPGLSLCEEDIQAELERRRPGKSRFTSQRREPDQVRIVSGVFETRQLRINLDLAMPILPIITNMVFEIIGVVAGLQLEKQ